MDDERVIEKVFSEVNRDEVVELALAFGNVKSPAGYEGEVSNHIYEWLNKEGLSPQKQEVLKDRFNVIGQLKGEGGGKSLILNAHIDTAKYSPEDFLAQEEEKPFFNSAWVEGDRIYGAGVVNDKGLLACTFIAAKAIKKSGVKLKGDLILTAVMGEIGQSPVDEFQGSRYMGKGLGTKFLVDHGILADYALVAEACGGGMTWAEAGVSYFKISMKGRPYYTPYFPHSESLEKSPNPIVKMARFIELFEEWAKKYEKENRLELPCGDMIPKAGMGSIRAGLPFKPAVSPEICCLYVDVRIPPNLAPLHVQKELEGLVKSVDPDGKVEMFLWREGAIGEGIEEFKEAISKAHEYVFGQKQGKVEAPVTSMWRDNNIFNLANIPSITYGPGSGTGGGGHFFSIDEMEKATKAYALVALDLCGISDRT